MLLTSRAVAPPDVTGDANRLYYSQTRSRQEAGLLRNYLKTMFVGRELSFDKLRTNVLSLNPRVEKTRRSVF